MRKRAKRADRVSATEAAKGLGGLVDKVRERGATFTIERGGVPVARLGPVADTRCTVADLVEHLRGTGLRDAAFARQVRAHVRRVNRPAVPPDRWAS